MLRQLFTHKRAMFVLALVLAASGGSQLFFGRRGVVRAAAPPPPPTTLVVMSTGDGTANAGNCPGAGCRLRDAIATAQGGETITFDPGVFAGPQTISLTAGELLIDKNLTITGTGAKRLMVQRSTAANTPEFRIFNISGALNVNLSGLTIDNGLATSVGGG